MNLCNRFRIENIRPLFHHCALEVERWTWINAVKPHYWEHSEQYSRLVVQYQVFYIKAINLCCITMLILLFLSSLRPRQCSPQRLPHYGRIIVENDRQYWLFFPFCSSSSPSLSHCFISLARICRWKFGFFLCAKTRFLYILAGHSHSIFKVSKDWKVLPWSFSSFQVWLMISFSAANIKFLSPPPARVTNRKCSQFSSFSKSVFSINYQELSDENKLTNPTVFECIE